MLEQRKFFDVHQLVNMGPQVVICKKRGNESKAGKKRRNNQDEKKWEKLARSRLEEWGDWTDCSATCGSGTRERTRECLSIIDCSEGSSLDSGACNTQDCGTNKLIICTAASMLIVKIRHPTQVMTVMLSLFQYIDQVFVEISGTAMQNKEQTLAGRELRAHNVASTTTKSAAKSVKIW